MRKAKRVLLFDVDGTLTLPRQKIEKPMKEKLLELKKDYTIAIVGGGSKTHIQEQLDDVYDSFDFIFSENGLVSWENGKVINEVQIKEVLGDTALRELIDFSLLYMADMDLPFKRGTFFELRTALINIAPMGRNCTYEERLRFNDFDAEHNVLKKFRDALDEKFSKKFNLVFSLGSSISIDCFIEGWRKPYCLKFLKEREIVFFGDKTIPGGNDYEISLDPRIKKSFTVLGPEDTLRYLNDIEKHFE